MGKVMQEDVWVGVAGGVGEMVVVATWLRSQGVMDKDWLSE